MKQQNLFERFSEPTFTLPRARHDDDSTSHEAARNHVSNAKSNCRVILNFVIRNPGLTSAEIGKQVGIGRVEVGRRLPDLLKSGFVRKGPKRSCTTNGNSMVTWEAEQHGC